MVHVWPDPVTSPTIPRSPDIATIRIISPFDFSDWEATRDARKKSVLNGFASVGGLWTVVDAVFVLLFGSFLMRTLFGTPYSRLSVCQHDNVQPSLLNA